MLGQQEYEALRTRPAGRAVMRQKWRDLLFLHASFEPQVVQKLLPAGLTVDTFPDSIGRERAWLGLVPFRMEGIRPLYGPALPWLSKFPETNVRTYVHREGCEPGVWFFSLDAARRLACSYARTFFKLPYFHAFMRTSKSADDVAYVSKRLNRPSKYERGDRCVRSRGRPMLAISAALGSRLPSSEYGSLEFFLIERYLLYSTRGRDFFTGRVYHSPYPLRVATLKACEENLVEAATGIDRPRWEHVCFSEGVDVEVFRLRSL